MSKTASNENLKTGLVVGIDLGTTNSCIAVMEGTHPKVLENPDGGRTTPSVFAFNKKKGIFVVGNEAHRQLEGKITSIKRKMGTSEKVQVGEKEFTPEQVSAEILRYLVGFAEKKLGQKITRAVITVPAYFEDAQKKATKNAGEIAGLKVERTLSEPTAAALAYGLDRSEREQKILVYDLGGGTFDVSILQISKGAEGGVFETLSVAGINNLGGDEFDKKIFDYAITKFKKETGIDLLAEGETDQERKEIKQRLVDASEEAKKELSGNQETVVSLRYLIAPKGDRSPHVEVKITRAEFEDITHEYINKTSKEIDKALTDAKLTKNDIDQVILVGGSTRMPMVEKLIKEKFGEKKINKSVNPDEVVAIGAAIQGGVLMGDVKDILLLDVTPLSLGIRVQGARDEEALNDVLIPRNTTIPTERKRIYSTAEDNQPSVHIQVLQGERPKARDNKILGNFELTGIAPASRGFPQIEVTFEIDANGILKITAADLQSKKKESLTVEGGQGLSKEEIERMVKEAEEFKAKDEEFKANSELLNRAQTYLSTFTRQIEEFKNHKDFKEDDPQFQEFKKLYDELKKATEAKDYPELKRQINKIDELMKISNELMQKMPKEEKKGEEEDTLDVPSEKKDDDKK